MSGLKHNFTPEKLAKYSYEDIASIRSRSIGLAEDLVAMCDAELAKRPPPPPPRKTRAYPIRKLEKEVCKDLERLANKLLNKYDLSKETALKLSEGTKQKQALDLLSPDGSPKLGGRGNGSLAIDRYISYKVKDQLFALSVIIASEADPSEVRFQVLAPENYVQGYKPISELRPYLKEGEEIGSAKGGVEFDNFKEASELFSLVIDSIAPKFNH